MIRQIVLDFIANNDVKIALYMSTIYVRSDQQMFVFIFWERIITKKCVHAVKRAVREQPGRNEFVFLETSILCANQNSMLPLPLLSVYLASSAASSGEQLRRIYKQNGISTRGRNPRNVAATTSRQARCMQCPMVSVSILRLHGQATFQHCHDFLPVCGAFIRKLQTESSDVTTTPRDSTVV